MTARNEVSRSQTWPLLNITVKKGGFFKTDWHIDALPPAQISLTYYDDGAGTVTVNGKPSGEFPIDRIASIEMRDLAAWQGMQNIQPFMASIAPITGGKKFAENARIPYEMLEKNARASFGAVALVHVGVVAFVGLVTFAAMIFALHLLFPAYSYDGDRVNPMLSGWWMQHGLRGSSGLPQIIWISMLSAAVGAGLWIGQKVMPAVYGALPENSVWMIYAPQKVYEVRAFMTDGQTVALASSLIDLETARRMVMDHVNALALARANAATQARDSISAEGFD